MVSAISYTRLTLALDIVRKLVDGPYAGFHELGIVKQKIRLGDNISVVESSAMKMICSHPGVPLDQNNICWKAVDLVKERFSVRQNVVVDIEKKIPVQGGLAGGSTNAATVIELLDELWGLGISLEDKVAMGRKLGMDVPFYFVGNSAYDTEATGVLTPFAHDMKLCFLLVVPPFGVSTADAYRGILYDKVGVRSDETLALRDALVKKDYGMVVKSIHNDFELSVFPKYPELVSVREQLMECGADNAFMSGSGSTMVGIFDDIEKVRSSAEKFSNAIVVESM